MASDSSAALPQRWRALALLIGGTFFAYVHRSALSIAAPFVSRDFDLSPAATGVMLSAFYWSYALSQVPSGWLADRFGVGRTYAVGFVLWACAASATGWAPSLAALVVLRLLMGAGQGVVFPSSVRATANWFPARERGGATATYLAGVRIGQAAVTAVGATAIAWYGWRWFFVLTTLAGAVWFVPWVLFHWRYERTPLAPQVAVTRVTAAESLRVLRDPRMTGILVTFFAVDYVWLLCATWIPGYFLQTRHFSTMDMTLYVSMPLVVASLASIASGIASDALVRAGHPEISVRRGFVVAGMLAGCAIGVVGVVASGHAAGVLVAVSICALGVAAPNIWSLTQAIAGRERTGLAGGAQNFVGNVGGIIAPIVTGVIAQATGSFALAFLLAASLLFLCACAGHLLIRDLQPEAASTVAAKARAIL